MTEARRQAMTSGGDAVRPRWSKPVEWWLTRAFVRGLNGIGRCIPPAALGPIGRGLGAVAYCTMRRYRRVAHANLTRAYGDTWSEERIGRVALQSFQHLGITLVEFFLRLARVTGEDAERLVRFEGQEHFEAAFARGKGVLLITAHYGNWEMLPLRLVRAGYRVNAITRTADDPGMERMIEAVRRRAGVNVIPRKRAAREGLAALRRNEILIIVLDQNTLEGGIFVPFFGHPASTATGPALFSLKTGAPLVPTFCLREADGTHTMKAWPPIYPEPSGDRGRDVYQLTAAVTRVIEDQIRDRPELWCWLHNRWKLQPPVSEQAAVRTGTVQCPMSNPQ